MSDTLITRHPTPPSQPRLLTLGEEFAAYRLEIHERFNALRLDMYERFAAMGKRIDSHEEEINELDGIAETSRHELKVLTADVKHLTNAMTAQLLPLDAWAKEIARLANGFEAMRGIVESQAAVLRSFQHTQEVHASNHALLIELMKKAA